MTTRPLFEKFRKGDLVQYFNNILDIVTEEHATNLKISEQRETLAEVMERFNASWQPSRGSELTPHIRKIDEERGSLFMGLNKTVKAWALHHYDEEIKSAACLIADKIDDVDGRIPRLRYQQKTATINMLLMEFSGELADKISLLGLTKWVEILQDVNTSFDDKYLERTNELAKEQEGLVLKLRKESIEAYRSLISLFEARMAVAEVDGEDVSLYYSLNNVLGELASEYNEAVQKHSSKEEKDENIVEDVVEEE